MKPPVDLEFMRWAGKMRVLRLRYFVASPKMKFIGGAVVSLSRARLTVQPKEFSAHAVVYGFG